MYMYKYTDHTVKNWPYMSRNMRKPAFCIRINKGADLGGVNIKTHQLLSFCYMQVNEGLPKIAYS